MRISRRYDKAREERNDKLTACIKFSRISLRITFSCFILVFHSNSSLHSSCFAPRPRPPLQVGYDQSNMAMHSYDWRLSPKKLEERDQYFSRLKASIEVSVNALGEKAQLVSHSMGSNVIFYFLQWVTQSASKGGGDGGKDWVAKYVAGHVNIAGPLLGTPKALTAILSGEMRDTAEMSPFEPMLQNFFGREKRRDMFSTWGSLWTLMSKGGNAIWDGNLVTFTDGKEGKEAAEATNSALAKFGAAEVRTTEEFIDVLVAWGGGHGHDYHKKIDISFAQSKVGGKQTESR